MAPCDLSTKMFTLYPRVIQIDAKEIPIVRRNFSYAKKSGETLLLEQLENMGKT